VNDPNGCAYVDGRYHVFFQYNPAGPFHGAICWGHISSADLIRWRDEPIALAPRAGELDRYGCWSGCVLDDDGTPTAAYSAVWDADVRSVVLLAHSDRTMRTWRQGRDPVAPTPGDPAVTHARDPFVFTLDGRRYAVQGAGHCEAPGAAQVLVYDCDDLTSWRELGPLLTVADPIAARVAPAHIWECPNLVRFEDGWVLIVSLWLSVNGGHLLAGVRYLVGDVVVSDGAPRFTPTGGGSLDRGPCFYAPQVLRVGDRILLWGWAREHGRTPAELDRAGWAGVLTFCRELSLEDGTLRSRRVGELVGLRRGSLDVEPDVSFTADAFEVELGPGAASLWLVDGDEEEIVAEVDASDEGARILVDGSIVEVFDGHPEPLTTRAYPSAESAWILRTTAVVAAWRLGVD
jgi:beta-fructofuranosidase